MNVRRERDHFLYLEYLRMIQNYEALKVYALSFFFFVNVRRKSFCNKILQNQPKVRHLQLYICMCMYVCI